MRKYFTVISLFLFAKLSLAQNCPSSYAGTKTLYPAMGISTGLPPKGYQPVFINHVGRHGARHLTKDVNTSVTYSLLQKAEAQQSLTEKGLALWQMVLRLEKIEKKSSKSISLIGMEEQKGIAARMYDNNKNIFASKDVLSTIMTTKEIRTQQSATAFLAALKTKTDINIPSQQVDDTILRFFDLSPVYLSFEEDGIWQQPFEEFKREQKYDILSQQLLSRFFKASFLTTIDKKTTDKFIDDVFGFAVIIPSISQEITQAGFKKEELEFSSFFSCDELTAFGLIANAEDYLLKGPGSDSLGIQVKVAVPLLVDYIKATDKFLTDNKEPVRLRFAHAETIAPFAALLGITNASGSAALTKLADTWKAEEIIPLSANIQWIVYQKNKKSLVKIMLNEKTVLITGLRAKRFPFYSWKALRSFYINKLRQVDASFNESGMQYLLRVK